ncbi:MAG: hypothetical protein AB7F43_00860 [Bacteriovoracia bacterium]
MDFLRIIKKTNQNGKDNQRLRQQGQGLVEYIALTALLAIVCIGGIRVLGSKVRVRLNQITTTFDRTMQQGLSRTQQPDSSQQPRASNAPNNNSNSNVLTRLSNIFGN